MPPCQERDQKGCSVRNDLAMTGEGWERLKVAGCARLCPEHNLPPDALEFCRDDVMGRRGTNDVRGMKANIYYAKTFRFAYNDSLIRNKIGENLRGAQRLLSRAVLVALS